MKPRHLITTIALLLCPLKNAVGARTLSWVADYDFEDPDGLTYDPTTGAIWVAADGRDDLGNPIGVISRLDADRNVDFSFTTPEPVEGITAFFGNLLVSQTVSNVIRQYNFLGTKVGADIAVGPTVSLASGLHFDTAKNELLVVDSMERRLTGFSFDGIFADNLATSATITTYIENTNDLFPIFGSPNGVIVDPRSGNFLILDDDRASSRMYEVTPGGQLVGSCELDDGFLRDPDGIAYDPVNELLYIGEASADTLWVFSDAVPELETSLLLGLVLLWPMAARRRR